MRRPQLSQAHTELVREEHQKNTYRHYGFYEPNTVHYRQTVWANERTWTVRWASNYNWSALAGKTCRLRSPRLPATPLDGRRRAFRYHYLPTVPNSWYGGPVPFPGRTRHWRQTPRRRLRRYHSIPDGRQALADARPAKTYHTLHWFWLLRAFGGFPRLHSHLPHYPPLVSCITVLLTVLFPTPGDSETVIHSAAAACSWRFNVNKLFAHSLAAWCRFAFCSFKLFHSSISFCLHSRFSRFR